MPLFSWIRMRPPTSIFLEGNVGAGKTTCALRMKEILASKGFDVLTMTEDVDRWKRQNLLGDMYASKLQRPSVRAFQVLGCLRQYLERELYVQTRGHGYDFIIYERHPSTTLEVFDADECVREMYHTVDAAYHFLTPPSYTVYIKTNPKECLRRVKRRARLGEKTVSLGYLERLEGAHEDMMKKRVADGGVVYEVDCSRITPEEAAARVCDAALRIAL